MIRRFTLLLLIPVMVTFGSGVYVYLGSLKSNVVQTPGKLPTVVKPRLVLPGTMILVQDGKIFKLQNGTFTQIASGNWMQPAMTPDHTRLVAVSRAGQSSDLFVLDVDGHVIKQLTHDGARIIDANHWAFYPHVTADGASVTYSYDSPKFGFRVDFAIWTMPLNGSQAQARRRTTPNGYTGGDVSPIPVSATDLLYVRHSIDTTGVHSQIWVQPRPFYFGTPLTAAADDCSQPSLSPDGTQLAMVCTGGKQSTRLEVAPFNGVTLGAPRVVHAGGLDAVPTWSPDGKGLAYLSPSGAEGHFQLWWLPIGPAVPAASLTAASPALAVSPSPTAAPVAPVQVTEGVDLSATSAPAWF
ncbi:MAG TPA: hypothetical protein VIN39_10430 [Candidatus Dormibacteraeota bacterium]|jgi:Tol biopolymer transport system component